MLIVSSAVFISFQGVNISEAEYTSEMTGRTFETDGADGSETALTDSRRGWSTASLRMA